MHSIEKCAKDSVSERELFALELEEPEEIEKFSLPTIHFACLIAWDSESVHEEKILQLLRVLIDSGAAYICCWGIGCERMHDLADHVDNEFNLGIETNDIIMTTWHENESLSEALWFLLNSTWPDRYAEETMGSTIAISMGNSDYAKEMRNALNDPRGFTQRVLDNEESAL